MFDSIKEKHATCESKICITNEKNNQENTYQPERFDTIKNLLPICL